MSLATNLGSLLLHGTATSATQLLIPSHCSSFKVNFRQRGCSMSLVTKLLNVIMLACAVAQDSAKLGQNDLDNLFVSHVQDYGVWRVMIFLKFWRTKFMY